MNRPSVGARACVSVDAPASTSGIARGDIHFGAHRADGGDQIDDPADLGFGLVVGEAVELRPWRAAPAGWQRFGRCSAVTAHSSSVMNGMNGCSSLRISSRAQAAMARVSSLAAPSGPVQQRLRQFEIPVAIDVPDEAIGGAGRLVEAVGFDRCVISATAFAVSCAIQRLSVSFADFGSKPSDARAAVDLGEARRVPQLGREIAVVLDVLRPEPDVVAGRDVAHQA